MDKYFLDFERPLEEIYKQIQALEIVSKENPDLQAQIDLLSKKYQEKEKKLYSNLSSWEKVMVARHPERPHTSDFIKLIFVLVFISFTIFKNSLFFIAIQPSVFS